MKNVSIDIFTTEECYALNKRLLEILKTDFAEETVVGKLILYLAKLDADLFEILAGADRAELERELSMKDKARNSAFIGLRDYCKAFSKAPNPVQAAAAGELIGLIREVGWSLHRQEYSDWATAQSALSEVLADPKYARSITLINAMGWVSHLKSANAAYEETLKLKIGMNALSNLLTINECKLRMIRYFKPLLEYLELMSDVNPERYAATAKRIDEAIRLLTTSAKVRSRQKENLHAELEALEKFSCFGRVQNTRDIESIK